MPKANLTHPKLLFLSELAFWNLLEAMKKKTVKGTSVLNESENDYNTVKVCSVFNEGTKPLS